MMIKRNNPKENMTLYERILGEQSFTMIDIGARGGVDSDWEKVKGIIHLVLFEPDEHHTEELKVENNKNTTIIPRAVWEESGVFPFYITRKASYCSMLKPDNEVLEGSYYFDRNFYEIERVEHIKVDRLSVLLKEYNVNNIDFMKIDIQGAELKALNSLETEHWDHLQGIKSEAYSAKLYQDSATISELLNLFYLQDLEIFDLQTVAKSPLTSSCGQVLYSKDLLASRPTLGYKGRLMVFDLLLLKNRMKILNLEDENILRKAVFTACVLGYFDRALDLIFRGQHLNILDNKITKEIRDDVLKTQKNSLSYVRSFTEKIKIRPYHLNKI